MVDYFIGLILGPSAGWNFHRAFWRKPRPRRPVDLEMIVIAAQILSNDFGDRFDCDARTAMIDLAHAARELSVDKTARDAFEKALAKLQEETK